MTQQLSLFHYGVRARAEPEDVHAHARTNVCVDVSASREAGERTSPEEEPGSRGDGLLLRCFDKRNRGHIIAQGASLGLAEDLAPES